MKKVHFYSVFIFCISSILFSSCKHKDDPATTTPAATGGGGIDASTPVSGYGILNHLSGIWNGPVTSSTALGGYPEWIVDFRPVSGAQVSAKNELDTVNNILMSFFIVKHGGAYKMAFRNGGGFAGNQRIAYSVIDSVSETTNNYFYRFADFKARRTITRPMDGGRSIATRHGVDLHETRHHK